MLDTELTATEIRHEIANRQRILRQLEGELGDLDREIPEIVRQHGELIDQLGVHEGAVVEAFKEANGGGPTYIDSFFRAESPRAAAVHAEHARLQANLDELGRLIKGKNDRRFALIDRYLPAARGWLEEAEQVRDQHHANVAAAERGERPTFNTIAARVFNR